MLPERVCDTCKNQREWGCDAVQTDEDDPQVPGEKMWVNASIVPLTIDHQYVWRCPRRPIKDDPLYWRRLLFFYSHYKEGRMPDEGGVLSQSFRAMMLFGVIEDTMTQVEQAKQEIADSKAARLRR